MLNKTLQGKISKKQLEMWAQTTREQQVQDMELGSYLPPSANRSHRKGS